MFGRSRPVVFDPYRHHRRRSRVPTWLWLLLAGIVTGAAGVVVAQQRWLPERLSAAETAQLRSAYAGADAERQRLQQVLDTAAAERDAARAERDALQRERDALAARVQSFDADLAFAVDALPPDPREAVVAVRAANLFARQGTLRYVLALSHGPAEARAIDGSLSFVVEGRSSDGREQRIELSPVALRIAARAVVRGEVALPGGFTPVQATVRIGERAGGRNLGMRVVRVR